jgi:hypothetical protein
LLEERGIIRGERKEEREYSCNKILGSKYFSNKIP